MHDHEFSKHAPHTHITAGQSKVQCAKQASYKSWWLLSPSIVIDFANTLSACTGKLILFVVYLVHPDPTLSALQMHSYRSACDGV